jgi:glucose/arabinose dehydrogenase
LYNTLIVTKSTNEEKLMFPKRALLLGLLLITGMILATQNSHQASKTVAASGEDLSTFLPTVMKPSILESLTLFPEVAGIGNETVVVITHAGDQRLFIATQSGLIFVVQRDPQTRAVLNKSIFLDLTTKVSQSFEEGLLGLVFHPNHTQNGYFYVAYTAWGTGEITLARYAISSDPNVADPNTRLIMMEITKPPNPPGQPTPYSPVHNAGDLHFGLDEYLYMATGDGGPDPYVDPIRPGDRYNNAQRTNVLLGKILRIDVNSQAPLPPDCGGQGYTIPADNPFVQGTADSCDEIWSYGWRNPWRFSIDALTGDMYIADVGEGYQEEVNFEPAGLSGRNYGWHCFEGTYDHRGASHLQDHCDEPLQNYTFPVFQYDRTQGFSVIGGFVYRGFEQSLLRGKYLFADFGSRNIWAMTAGLPNAVPQVLPATIDVPGGRELPQWTAFGRDAYGELFLGGYYHDAIYHITAP